jgi:hypothetical protein
MVNPMNLHGSKSQKSLCACRKKSSNSGTCSGKLRCKSRSCRGAFGDFAGTTRLSAVTRIVFGQPAPWSDFIAACANKPRAETRRASLLITDPNQWRTGHPGRVPPRVRNAHPIMANVTLRTARVAGAATGSGIHALQRVIGSKIDLVDTPPRCRTPARRRWQTPSCDAISWPALRLSTFPFFSAFQSNGFQCLHSNARKVMRGLARAVTGGHSNNPAFVTFSEN